MKYLVNRETKIHKIYCPEAHDLFGPDWHIVEADAEGWIKWDGGIECPLPDNCSVELVSSTGFKHTGAACGFCWNTVRKYRPILDKPEEYPPQETTQAGVGVNERSTDDIIARLKSAHEAAQTIPDLLAELREVLGSMGYDVVARSPFVPFTPSGEFEQPPVDDELTKNITVYSGDGR